MTPLIPSPRLSRRRVLTPFRAFWNFIVAFVFGTVVANTIGRGSCTSRWSFLSPVIGMFVTILVTLITTWIVKRQRPQRVDRWFRRPQLLSAAGYRLGHGTNDAQKGMGIITAAMVAGVLLKQYQVHS